jgi:hypothetical protein
MDMKLEFNPATAVFFMCIGGLATLIILGGTGALRKSLVSNIMQPLAIATIVLAVAAWVLDRIVSS